MNHFAIWLYFDIEEIADELNCMTCPKIVKFIIDAKPSIGDKDMKILFHIIFLVHEVVYVFITDHSCSINIATKAMVEN